MKPLSPQHINQLCNQIVKLGYKPTIAYIETILKAYQITYRPKDLHYWMDLWRSQSNQEWQQLPSPLNLTIEQFSPIFSAN